MCIALSVIAVLAVLLFVLSPRGWQGLYSGLVFAPTKPTVRGACRDGLAAYDYVTRELGFAPEKVIMHGVSLGSGVTCEVAGKRKVGAIILHGAFSSLRLVSVELLPITRYVPGFLFFRPSMDNAARLSRITVPLRLVHGEYDELFGPHHPKALLAASASKDKSLTVLPGCAHGERDPRHQQIVRELVEALSQPSRA